MRIDNNKYMRIIITIILAIVMASTLLLMYDAMVRSQCAKQMRHGDTLDEECVVEYDYYVRK